MKWLVILFQVFIYTVFIYTDSLASKIRWGSPTSCPGLSKESEDFYKPVWEHNKYRSYSRDVENTLSATLDSFKIDCKDEDSISIFEKKINWVIKRGWQSEINLLKNEISRVSNYRLPNKELDQLDKFTKKLGKNRSQIISENEIEKIIADSAEKRERTESDCTDKDNRRPPLNDKVRNQGAIGWCYAYTAADLLSHKTGKLISAVDVANSYNRDIISNPLKLIRFVLKDESERDGGFLSLAIKNAIDEGLCNEDNVRSSNPQKWSGYLLVELRELQKLKARFDKETYVPMAPGRNMVLQQKIRDDIRKQKIADFRKNFHNNLNDGFREVFKLTNDQMVDVLERSSSTDIINQAIKESCKNKRLFVEDIEIVSRIAFPLISSDFLIDDIDKQINEDNIVGVSYYADLLFDPYNKKSERHASSIVARKFDGGSCKYLIRNSWGENCKRKYSEKYECEKGQLWVPKEYLVEMIYGITYIK